MEVSIIVLVGGDYDKKLYEKCKKSFGFADEIVEVDTSKIHGSFAQWRNEGLKRAKGKWILYVDTDEEVSEKLKIEILKLIKNWKLKIGNCAYAVPRRNIIFGKEFKHGGQWPDYQKRLFLKSALKKWSGNLHEEPILVSDLGNIGHLSNALTHHKNLTLSQMVEKTNRWSEIEAGEMFKAHHPPMNFFRFFSAGFREFWLRFVAQLCFLDGTEGIIYGMYQVYSRLISYSKLWEKQLSTIHT